MQALKSLKPESPLWFKDETDHAPIYAAADGRTKR
jgi:hypothetical protein